MFLKTTALIGPVAQQQPKRGEDGKDGEGKWAINCPPGAVIRPFMPSRNKLQPILLSIVADTQNRRSLRLSHYSIRTRMPIDLMIFGK